MAVTPDRTEGAGLSSSIPDASTFSPLYYLPALTSVTIIAITPARNLTRLDSLLPTTERAFYNATFSETQVGPCPKNFPEPVNMERPSGPVGYQPKYWLSTTNAPFSRPRSPSGSSVCCSHSIYASHLQYSIWTPRGD